MDNTITDAESMSEEPQSFTTDEGKIISTKTGKESIADLAGEGVLPDGYEEDELIAEVSGVYLVSVIGEGEMDYAFVGQNPDTQEWDSLLFGEHEQDSFRALIDEV